ncbi:hypothetical protein P3T36_002660 [Kitasatospora sp. MAP12-15]|uniref:DUF4276 family protein n=1 Tax=unclassified Kitasatospora TaxID=2633591 RepID=UPI0024746A24|nr:DUF4276 family protein [Kitasatospora sp. MAP12-44]MDH6112943.1 hypothetical protein [Kitasatospora sp. MAP12-44]
MSRYLVPGLIAEGPEDQLFLGRVIVRQLLALGSAAGEPFDVQEFVLPGDCPSTKGAAQVAAAVADLAADCHIVFLHNDHRERDKIAKVAALTAIPVGRRMVGVVPVRETEAWLLADAELLRSVPGAVTELIPTSAAQAERVSDPKDLLSRILPGYDSRNLSEKLSNEIDLVRLKALPAYREWCEELTTVLKELHFL